MELSINVSAGNTIELYTPEQEPVGKPWNHWCAEWWKWLYSIPSPHNPIYGCDRRALPDQGNDGVPDPAFSRALPDQGKDGVIFLAGARSGLVERTCTIPKDKAIFFPVATCECSFAEFPTFSMDDLAENAKQGNKVSDMRVEIEIPALGKESRKALQMKDLVPFSFSGKFKIEEIPYDNIFGADNRTPSFGYYVGYWLCLKPIKEKTDFHLNISQDTEDNPVTNTFNSSYTVKYHLSIQ